MLFGFVIAARPLLIISLINKFNMTCRKVTVVSNERTFILSSETHYEAHEYVNIGDM